MRVGIGYDVHRLVLERPLILGGVTIPFEKGLAGHSDADVLVHAVMDALLGAAGLGDIGLHFPDSDQRFFGADSLLLLAEVQRLIQLQGMTINNIDATIVCQRPRLRPYIDQMNKQMAKTLAISESAINIKATTTEGVGPEGEGLSISAQAIVSLID